MFAMGETDLSRRILGCGDGPASFNVEATQRGVGVISADPLYAFSSSQIRERIAATSEQVFEQTRQHQHEFVWSAIQSPEELLRVRMSAMEAFLADFEQGKKEGRYVNAALPTLPFGTASFDLAVCSHFLFLYSDQLTGDFHCAAFEELCRVAREVRLFPLLTLAGARSPHVSDVTSHLRDQGYSVSIEVVPYEFQRGGNEMMRITSTSLNTERTD